MIPGLFPAKAYEGDYSNMGKWVQEIKALVAEVRRKTLKWGGGGSEARRRRDLFLLSNLP